MPHGGFMQLNVQGKKGQHYLTGMYYISKVTDYISTQGFVKTLRIIKNTASKLASGVELDGKMAVRTVVRAFLLILILAADMLLLILSQRCRLIPGRFLPKKIKHTFPHPLSILA